MPITTIRRETARHDTTQHEKRREGKGRCWGTPLTITTKAFLSFFFFLHSVISGRRWEVEVSKAWSNSINEQINVCVYKHTTEEVVTEKRKKTNKRWRELHTHISLFPHVHAHSWRLRVNSSSLPPLLFLLSFFPFFFFSYLFSFRRDPLPS